MRILFTIAHFYNPIGKGKYGSLSQNSNLRINALNDCVTSIKQLFDKQYLINIAKRCAIPVNQPYEYDVDIIICTTQKFHLLDHIILPSDKYIHHSTNAEPMLLGFECQSVLRDNLNKYDYYCFMEDDLILHDSQFFDKLNWFNSQMGESFLLQPNRFEISSKGPVYKAYIDGDLKPEITAEYQNVNEEPQITGNVIGRQILFKRPLNPHSGCYFLNAGQMEHWAKQPYFLNRDISFIGPLESAATLGIMRTFKIYKPVDPTPGFLEVQHYGQAFLNMIKLN